MFSWNLKGQTVHVIIKIRNRHFVGLTKKGRIYGGISMLSIWNIKLMVLLAHLG